MRTFRYTWVATLLIILADTAFAQQQPAKTPPQAPTEISADLGTCRVDFKVTDMLGKPIYDAKIKTVIRYGFLGKRKLSLGVGTNADGRARFVKMPEQVRDPLEFEITHGSDSVIMTWDPATNCEAEYPVLLGAKTLKE